MVNEYKEWYKSKGICVNCGKEKAWNGRLMCPECLEKTKINSERTRSRESKEQRKLYLKKKRELCVTFGICRECLKREATIGKKCLECHVKEVKRNEAKRTEVKKNMRVELGLCYFCGQLSENGYKTCEKHHKIMANNFSKWDRNNNNHYWRQIQGGEVKVVQYKKKLLGVV